MARTDIAMSPYPVIITTGRRTPICVSWDLELQPVHIRQADVDNDASGFICKVGAKKIVGRRVRSWVPSPTVSNSPSNALRATTRRHQRYGRAALSLVCNGMVGARAANTRQP